MAETVVRTELFVYAALDNLSSKKRSRDLEQYYKVEVIGAIKEKLDNIVQLCKEISGSQDIERRQIRKIYIRVSSFFEILDKIYYFMNFLRGDDIRPEADLLCDQIRKSFIDGEIFKEINVFQTYMYNFSEGEEDIPELSIENKGPISLSLPEIEVNNPLMWAQLSHEMAHFYIDAKDLVQEIKQELLEEIIGIHQQKIFSEWAKEIISDVIALRLFGVGYYTSFISTAIKIGGLRTHTIGHPSHRTRVDVMSELLVSTSDITQKLKELVNFYGKIFSLWTEWEIHKYQWMGSTPNSDDDIFIGNDLNEEEKDKNKKAIQSITDKKIPFKIARFADEQMDSILKEVYSLNEIEKLNRLSKVLNKGIIISSCRAQRDGDIINAIREFKSRGEITTDDAYELISNLTEIPNSIFDIINSGWMYRYKSYYRKIDDSLFSENMTFEDGYENFKKELIRYDELLLKSIENAQLHEIFKGGGS